MKATWNGEKLRMRRKELGLTMAELAARINCTRPIVSMWEDNKSSPSGHLLVALGIALNIHPKEFYSLEQ